MSRPKQVASDDSVTAFPARRHALRRGPISWLERNGASMEPSSSDSGMLQWASRADPRLFRNSLSLPHHAAPLDSPRSSAGLPGNLKPVLRRISSAGRTSSSAGNAAGGASGSNADTAGSIASGTGGVTNSTAEAAASAVAAVQAVASGEGRESGEAHIQRALVLERINSAPASSGAGAQRVQVSASQEQGDARAANNSFSPSSSGLFSLQMDLLKRRSDGGSVSPSARAASPGAEELKPRGWLKPITARIGADLRQAGGSGLSPSSRGSTPKATVNGVGETVAEFKGSDRSMRLDAPVGGEIGEVREQSASDSRRSLSSIESGRRPLRESTTSGKEIPAGWAASPPVAAAASPAPWLYERAPSTSHSFFSSSSLIGFLMTCMCIFVFVLTWKITELQRTVQALQSSLSEGMLVRATPSSQTCVLPPSFKSSGSEEEEPLSPVEEMSGTAHTDDRGWRGLALTVSIVSLVLPVLLLHYVDQLPRLGLGILFTGKVGEGAGGDEEVPLSKRLAYRVDVLFSTYSWVKPLALLGATTLLISLGGLALYAVSSDQTLSEATWAAWTFVADAGNHADSKGVGPRIVSITISFGGMLIFALMLGLVSDAISEKVDSLRKGKSEVIESNHTLVLGWSDKLGPMIKQLAVANQSIGGGVVVVLAEREKEEMESEIAKLEFDFLGTSVICRSGSPLVVADLKKVSVSTARAIIVLAEVENADQSDARALRVVLSLTGVREGLRGHIVVELSDLDNEQLVKMVGGQLVETVVAHDVIGRLMIQCARQPGLAQIWEDILGFESCEFYMKCWQNLAGMTFGDVFISFPEAIPCGVRIAADGGRIMLNPPDSYVLKPKDALLVVAEDENSYAPGPLPQIRRGNLPDVAVPPKMPEKILFCGWRRDIDDMITVLEAFLARGSELWMFSDVPIEERESRLREGGLEELVNIRIEHRVGNAVIRRHLESLPLENFDSILILADEAMEDTVMNADSRSLATLLLIRDIQSKRMPYNKTARATWVRQMQQLSSKSIIISEILDSRTRSLVSVSKISDYVLSNELVSMALAMVAEDREINRVLEELFAEEGNEMYIRPAGFYVYDEEELSFLEVMVRARKRMEIMIGYRLEAGDKAVINPPNKGALRRWSLMDTFVVFALEE